jgi:hypothetical protein
MPKYLIERELPGAGKMNAQELQDVAIQSCNVLEQLGPQIQWVHSYVTGDKIYCIYNAPSEALIQEHARQSGFPANSIVKVEVIIDPVTSES